ncbi:MAG: ATP-binding cassette domain-containing protein [Archaeoglobus sp.]|nr:ATP-binding cassette domain-containing protein [Archaeoglobus sp.]
MLKLKRISKQFNSLVVLKDVSLSLQKGEAIGLCGPNGSGKSTLLKIISGFEKPTCGKVFLNDRDITKFAVEKRVELGLSFAFQIPRPFAKLSVYENVLSGCLLRYEKEEAMLKAEELLKTFHLESLADRKAENLSQGELKLLELCRSLSTEPDYVLLDEPYAALDKENTRKVRRMLRKMKRMEVGMLITAHRTKILEGFADEVFWIELGRISRVDKGEKL